MPNPLAWPITVITGQSLPKGSQQKYGNTKKQTETAMHTVVCFQSFLIPADHHVQSQQTTQRTTCPPSARDGPDDHRAFYLERSGVELI